MAAQDRPEDPPELFNCKTWVLKVSIHCEGCKRKVKKILQQVPGVSTIDIDLKQQKATVTGNVEAETLLRKLHKSGKHAELVPQQTDHQEKKSAKIKKKEKQIDPQTKEAELTSQPDASTTQKNVESAGKIAIPKEPSVKTQDASDEVVRKKSEKSSTGSAKLEEKTGTASDNGPAVAEKQNSNETVKESKSEGKKPVTDSAGKEQIPVAAEKKGTDSDDASASGGKSGGGPVGEASGSTGKKKKKKGQNSNNTEGTPSIVAPAGPEFENHNMGPQVFAPTNDSPPRHQAYHYYPQQGPQFYAPPPAYVVSYNTAQPTAYYTASYYAPAPPTSYAYTTYSGPVREPPPSDVDTYPRQPLDLEVFSDENPNGCFVM